MVLMIWDLIMQMVEKNESLRGDKMKKMKDMLKKGFSVAASFLLMMVIVSCGSDHPVPLLPPQSAVPSGMTPKLISSTSVASTDSATDGTWVAWSAESDVADAGASEAGGVSRIFIQKATDRLAPEVISPDVGFVDGGNSLWNVVVQDGLVVWRAWDGSGYHIYAYDLEAGTPAVIDISGSAINPDCFHTRGRVIVWHSGTSPDFTVHIYKFDDDELISVPVYAKDTIPYPKTDGRFVAWMAGPWPVFDIYAYDLDAAVPAPVKLTNGGWNAMPVVDNGIVAWYGGGGGDVDEIYYADAKLATPLVVRITNNAVGDQYPEISNGVIVWAASDGSDREIYYYDTKAATPSIVQITNNATEDGMWPSIPRISQGLITWAGAVAGVTGNEIFYYDLQAASPRVVRLTNNEIDERMPRVTGGLITWIGGGATYAARR